MQFWPHSNCAPLTVGVYLEDVRAQSGPMTVVPLSHHNALHPHEDADGNWLAVLPEEALAQVPLESAVEMGGPAGTVIVHNCRCVHGSAPNLSPTSRPLLLQTYAPASSALIPAGSNIEIQQSARGDQLIRGRAREAVWDPRAEEATQEAPWMPDPGAVAFDWQAAAALLRPD